MYLKCLKTHMIMRRANQRNAASQVAGGQQAQDEQYSATEQGWGWGRNKCDKTSIKKMRKMRSTHCFAFFHFFPLHFLPWKKSLLHSARCMVARFPRLLP